MLQMGATRCRLIKADGAFAPQTVCLPVRPTSVKAVGEKLRSNHSPQRQGLNAQLTDMPKPVMQSDQDGNFFTKIWSAR